MIKNLSSILFITLLICSCRSNFMEINHPGYLIENGKWELEETEHFKIYYRSEPSIDIDSLSITQEMNFKKICKLINVEKEIPKINIFVFNDLEDYHENTNAQANAFCILGYNTAYYRGINSFGSHEVTHLIAYHDIGIPKEGCFKSILEEGLAQYSDEKWYKRDAYKYCANKIFNENGSTLLDYINSYDDDSIRIKWSYVDAAFTKFLLDNYSVEQYRQLYKTVEVAYDFEKILGISFEVLNKEFVDFLKKNIYT